MKWRRYKCTWYRRRRILEVKPQEAKRLNVKAAVGLHHSLTSWLFLNSMQDE
jgi:hypothetical protein